MQVFHRDRKVGKSGEVSVPGHVGWVRPILIVLLAVVVACPVSGQVAEEKTDREAETDTETQTDTEKAMETQSVVRVSASGELKKIEGSDEYSISFDLGNLPMGKTAVMRLEISNPLDEDVRYTDVSKRCVCSQFAPRQSTVPKNGSRSAVLRMKTPASSQTSRVSIPVLLLRGGEPVIRMSLDFGLEGLLSFTQLVSVVRFENDDTTRTQDIPFLVTSPVTLDELQVEHSDNLNGVDFEILPGTDGGILRATIPDSVLADGDVRGEVFLVNAERQQRRTLYFSIKDGRRSEISPRVIHFRRAADGWRAAAVVRLGRKMSGAGQAVKALVENTDARQTKQWIRCQYRGQPVDLKLSQISDLMYRVELFVAAGSDVELAKGPGDSDSSVLNWLISDGESDLKLTTPIVMDSSSGN